MIKGSCLCGEIAYEYRAEITEVAICHCSLCKKAQGTPFATNAHIRSKYFSYTKGSELTKAFYSSTNKKRVFCSNCGSPLYSQRTDMPEVMRLRLGTVTEGDIPKPHYEQYCVSKSVWYNQDSNRPAYSKGKP